MLNLKWNINKQFNVTLFINSLQILLSFIQKKFKRINKINKINIKIIIMYQIIFYIFFHSYIDVGHI